MLLGRARAVLTRLLRAPTESHRRFDEASDKLDELRSGLAELRTTLPPLVADLQERLAVLDARVRGLEQQAVEALDLAVRSRSDLDAVAITTGHVAERLALGEPPTVGTADGPLVSVVVPCRDRAASLEVGLRSLSAQTYQRWECVVVDDGSKEDLAAVLDAVGDDRIRLVVSAGEGVAAARNRGLEAATGEVVTFLDSDNWWFPRRLESVVAAMAGGARWAFDRQLVLRADGRAAAVRADEQPLDELANHNFIDIGQIAVRAGSGRFEPALPRLSDWDLVRRLAAEAAPVRIPYLGQVYDERSPDRITAREPFGPSYHQIRRAAVGQPAAGLRVLLAEWHFPQLTETYVQSDVAGLLALGATVEAWSDDDVQTPYDPGIAVHRGPLGGAVDAFGPDLVLSHWLHVGRDHRATLRDAGVPHAIRGHGFDHDDGVVDELLRERGTVVHLFPHLGGRWASHPGVSLDPVGFDPSRVRPAVDRKDRRLVVRTVAGLLTKDLDTFMLTAARCPEHRFVLVIGRTFKAAEQTDTLIERVQALGAPVEVRVDVPHAEAAALVERAGIYLHTHGDGHALGMPISVAEAMATGAYVLARELPGMVGYGRDAVARYTGATSEARADHAAALINATLAWSEERWEAAGRASLDTAWVHHPADLVVARLLEVWRERLGVGRPT